MVKCTVNIPNSPSLDGLENKWSCIWEQNGIYAFTFSKNREGIYSIDTPPPTVSGTLHVGHVFSYTHTDFVARYKRMCKMDVFYPMGWDDNGLPTERRVQNHYGVLCDPNLYYVPDFKLPPSPTHKHEKHLSISRQNFIELCLKLTEEDEQAFEKLWKYLGLSVDWSNTYTTIGLDACKISQRSFLRLLKRGIVYQNEAPSLWDIDFQTAVSQAELEDREQSSAYYKLRFVCKKTADESSAGEIEIDTTRPELLPACVAVVAHPDDKRYQPLFGKKVLTPLFGSSVEVLPHEAADPQKGTGAAMVCTFGDTTDITWWKGLNLPLRTIIDRSGRLQPIKWGEGNFECMDTQASQEAYNALVGLTINQARKVIVELLSKTQSLLGEPRPIKHMVKFYEKGEHPLEIVTSRQWFIKILDLKEDLLKRGEELCWWPPSMATRYRTWVEGLNSDWNISRQRFFGVPIPLWYRLDENGNTDHSNVIIPEEDELPIDPSSQAPKGFTEEQRGKPNGFIGELDVLDTWATSSLTPQIAGKWSGASGDEDLFSKVFPMDLRPQGQDIIRTWLFSTVVRSHLEHNSLPFKNAAISGFVLDPDRKKMSKSKGNVITPLPLLEQHGSDAVRYWAAMGRPGVDTAADPGQMKVGRRLATKILNASRFVLDRLAAAETQNKSPGLDAITQPLDKAMLSLLGQTIQSATTLLDNYDYTRALEQIENFFWNFCDNYLELVKTRVYNDDLSLPPAASGLVALETALSIILRLFAPFMPFVTEEVWSWWHTDSVHTSPWPRLDKADLGVEGSGSKGEGNTARGMTSGVDNHPNILLITSEVLSKIRKAKTEQHVSMRARVESLIIYDSPERLDSITSAEADLMNAGNVAHIQLIKLSPHESPLCKVEVRLQETPPKNVPS